MRAMWRASAVLVGAAVMFWGCGDTGLVESDGGAPAVDATDLEADGGSVQRDAGHELDSGSDLDAAAGRDGGTDAGMTEEPDAGPEEPECTVLPQSGCAEGEACRLWRWEEVAPSTWRWEKVGPHCAPEGTMEEHETGCRHGGRDWCQADFYCGGATSEGCVRHCTPGEDDCPDYYSYEFGMYQEQGCVTHGGEPYCSRVF